MATSWGPVEKPEHHDVKPIAAEAEGAVTEPHPDDRDAGAPGRSQNYNATDGRHSKSDHEGWPSIDPMSGGNAEGDFIAKKRFTDGPGPWRQT